MRIGFKTTLEEDLIRGIKISALQQGINVNDILETLIMMYLNGMLDANAYNNAYNQCQSRRWDQNYNPNQRGW